MRILGIDYGEKRVGLAVSDELYMLARELTIVPFKDFFSQLPAIIEENEIERVVIGWPLNMNGEETQKTQEVGKFKEKLESIVQVPVETIDERFSSQMAEHLPGGRKNIDSLAAQIILQNYLNKQKALTSGQ